MPLAEADQKKVQALVGPTAWAVVGDLELDLEALAEAHGGNLKQVAADVLDEAVLNTPATVAGKVKVGSIEVPVGPDVGPVAWADKASRYRSEVGSTLPGPAWAEFGVDL